MPQPGTQALLHLVPTKYLFQPYSLAHSSETKFFWIFFIHETADSHVSEVAILSILISVLSSDWRQRLKPLLVRGIGRGGFRNLDYTESYHFASINIHLSVCTIFGIMSRPVTAPIPFKLTVFFSSSSCNVICCSFSQA